jgi:hypothetical protein
MKMTMKIEVPVEVSPTALALWIHGMLNTWTLGETGVDEKYQAEMDLLDSMDDEVTVTWGSAHE